MTCHPYLLPGEVYSTPYERERREYMQAKQKFTSGDGRGFVPASGKGSSAMPLRAAGGVAAEGTYHGHPDALVARRVDKGKFVEAKGWMVGGDRNAKGGQRVGYT